MTLERLGSEELPKPHASGFGFLLDPGGEDYVGNNSYDDLGPIDE